MKFWHCLGRQPGPWRLGPLLGLLVLLGSLFLMQGYQTSWAAPNQNPHRQTVPPRTPTPTPRPFSPDNNNKDRDEETLPPLPSPAESGVPAEEEAPTPTPLPDQRGPATAGPAPSTPAPPVVPITTPGTAGPAQGAPLSRPQADLALAMLAATNRVRIGETVTFTLTVTNAGPDSATGVVVRTMLPPALSLSLAWSDRGYYSHDQDLWQVGTLLPGEKAVLRLMLAATAAGETISTAEIVAVAQPDPDSTPANGRAEEDDQASLTIAAAQDITSLLESRPGPAVASAVPGGEGEAAPRLGQASLSTWLVVLVLGMLLVLTGFFLANKT